MPGFSAPPFTRRRCRPAPSRPSIRSDALSMTRYPPARQSDVADDYHGVRVADPYRWLEDPESAETIAWVYAENQLARASLDSPGREDMFKQLTKLYDFPRTSVPTRRGRYYFFTQNSGLQRQEL